MRLRIFDRDAEPDGLVPVLNKPNLRLPAVVETDWLSNRIFKSFDDIVDHCCYAWNTLIDQPWKIMSIARRDWTTMGHSM